MKKLRDLKDLMLPRSGFATGALVHRIMIKGSNSGHFCHFIGDENSETSDSSQKLPNLEPLLIISHRWVVERCEIRSTSGPFHT